MDTQQQELLSKYVRLYKSLHPISGDVEISQANATLRLGTEYYFLNASDAKRILIEAWGNPPSAVDDVLGLVFPKGKTFADDTWGAVITYHQTGYVSDSDAQSADYNKLTSEIQSHEDNVNANRVKEGFPTMHLVGWAQQPSYDSASHSVIWARDLRFGDQKNDTLNYDVRLLGRRGVLSLNMISTMPKLAEIQQAASVFRGAVSYDAGARYQDYNASTDKSAGYGIAGLVAAGVGVAAAKKLGLLAFIALAGKKLFVLIGVAFLAAMSKIKRIFTGKEAE